MKSLAIFYVAALLLTVPVSAQSLDPSDLRLLRGSLNERPYRLWVPEDYDGRRSYPLVLFLHGGAGRGRDNERHLLDGNGMLINLFVTAQPRFPSIVLAPQTSAEHGVEPTLAVLRHVLKEYRVDRTRVYLIGQSLGGYGALDVLASEPTLFAAAVVISAGGQTNRVQRHASVPTWFFHGERDEVIPVEQPRRIVAAIKRAGGRVRYTEYKGEGHALAWLVVRQDSLIPWIFSQRGRTHVTPRQLRGVADSAVASTRGALARSPNKRLKLAARLDYGMTLSPARRSLSAIRWADDEDGDRGPDVLEWGRAIIGTQTVSAPNYEFIHG